METSPREKQQEPYGCMDRSLQTTCEKQASLEDGSVPETPDQNTGCQRLELRLVEPEQSCLDYGLQNRENTAVWLSAVTWGFVTSTTES